MRRSTQEENEMGEYVRIFNMAKERKCAKLWSSGDFPPFNVDVHTFINKNETENHINQSI